MWPGSKRNREKFDMVEKNAKISYGRKNLKAGTLLAPLPAVMVTSGTLEQAGLMTAAWTGIVNTRPPMTYISVRPTRYSYEIIKKSREFVINLTTSKMVWATDFCGVKSGRDVPKIKKCGLHLVAASSVKAPIIEESPLALECRVVEIKPLGSHDMFIAEILSVSVDKRYIDSKGKINLNQAGLMAYSHGEYFALGRKLGSFGYSVKKK